MALAITFGLAAGAAAETIAGTDFEAAELVADLPRAFEVAVTEEATVRTTRYRFSSAGPIRKTAVGDVGTAEGAFKKLLVDPNTGPIRPGTADPERRPGLPAARRANVLGGQLPADRRAARSGSFLRRAHRRIPSRSSEDQADTRGRP